MKDYNVHLKVNNCMSFLIIYFIWEVLEDKGALAPYMYIWRFGRYSLFWFGQGAAYILLQDGPASPEPLPELPLPIKRVTYTLLVISTTCTTYRQAYVAAIARSGWNTVILFPSLHHTCFRSFTKSALMHLPQFLVCKYRRLICHLQGKRGCAN